MTKLLKLQIPLDRQWEAAEAIHRGELLTLEDLGEFLGLDRRQAIRLYNDKEFLTFVHNVRMAASKFDFDRTAPRVLKGIVESEESKPNEKISAVNAWADLVYPNRKKSEVNVNFYSLESLMQREKSIDIEGKVKFPGIDEE